MNSLNTDCLLEIIKYLNLRDQITLHQVNEHLREAVTTLWIIKYKHVHINFLELPLSKKEFDIFLKSIQDIVEILQIKFLNQEKYEILKKFRLLRVRNFRFSLSKPYFMEDRDLKDLQNVMPNLEALSPHGNLSGQYMDEWPLLKDLNLSFCLKLEMMQFQNIMSNLKLEKLKLNIFPNNKQFEQMNLSEAQVENLKYLELNTYEFYYFLAKPLTNLKELIITNHYNPRQLFDVILSVWQAKQIRLVETGNVDNILVNCVEMHMNIEELCLANDENSIPANVVPSLHLLTDLRKLRFYSCSLNSTNTINLLKNVPQVEELSFVNCQFDEGNMCVKIGELLVNRRRKLRLNWFENRLRNNLDRPEWLRCMEEATYISIDVIGDDPLFELTRLKGRDLTYEPLYVVFR